MTKLPSRITWIMRNSRGGVREQSATSEMSTAALIPRGGTLLSAAAPASLLRRRGSSFQIPPFSACTGLYFPSTIPRISSRMVSKISFIEQLSWVAKSYSRALAHPTVLNGSEPPGEDFVVVNFYRFVYVHDPEAEVAKHLSFLEGRDIHGRIYLNEQGINAQYSGPKLDALAYIEWLKEDDHFSDILVQISPTSSGHAFPRLKLRYKPSLVQLEGGILHLPLVDPAMRATPLAPSEWKGRLQAMKNADKASFREDSSDISQKSLLLDVRNGYEWDVGHFQGAERPNVDCFRSTSFGLCEAELADSDPLAGVDKEGTDILMYCTGGIRCDVYSTILRQRGFQNLYTLSGGVSHYLKSEGPVEWVGNLFVFDSRLSLPPSAYKSEVVAEGAESNDFSDKTTFARCHICGSHVHEFRHRNCANLDCNLLFLSCANCIEEMRGCCSLDCTSAPRLRPVLPGYQRYQKWHIYRNGELQRM